MVLLYHTGDTALAICLLSLSLSVKNAKLPGSSISRWFHFAIEMSLGSQREEKIDINEYHIDVSHS